MGKLKAVLPFLLIHRRLLVASYTFDLVYLACSLFYLLIPVTLQGLSPANLGFLGLGTTAAFLYHIHILRGYTGGAAFYLTVPASRGTALLVMFAAALAPFLALFPVLAYVLHPDPPLVLGAAYFPVYERVAHCLALFFFIKTLSPVVLVMTWVHPALLLLIPVGLGTAWVVGTIVGEIADLPMLGTAIFFVLSALMATGAVAKAKM